MFDDARPGSSWLPRSPPRRARIFADWSVSGGLSEPRATSYLVAREFGKGGSGMPRAHALPAGADDPGAEFQKVARLAEAIRSALPAAACVRQFLETAERAYRNVAEVLVELRHEIRCPDGAPDLQGRSHTYRAIVRQAYEQAGALSQGPIDKRLTAGVAYWVRKLLLDRYGEAMLREIGILPKPRSLPSSQGTQVDRFAGADPLERLTTLIGVLNTLAADPDFVPPQSLIRSASRALNLLTKKPQQLRA